MTGRGYSIDLSPQLLRGVDPAQQAYSARRHG
jgi:hypothetical protein